MSITDPVRFSHLKHIGRSAAHYHHAVTVGRDDKPWLRGGRGLHCVLFEQPYTIFTGATRRGKEWERFLADHGRAVEEGFMPSRLKDVEVILSKELPVYQDQAESIRAELKRQGLSHLLEGDIEKRIEWEWLGRKCAGTPDVCHGDYIVDVKTTCNADPRRFVWDARKFSYAEQLVWYDRGDLLNRLREKSIVPTEIEQKLYIIAVEKTAPYPVVVWQVTEAKRLEAEKTLRLWFEQLLACEASDSWPGYAQCVQQLDVVDSEGITLTIGDEEVEVE